MPVAAQGRDERDGHLGGRDDVRYNHVGERPPHKAMPDRRGEERWGAVEPAAANNRPPNHHPMADPYPNRDNGEPSFGRHNRHHHETANPPFNQGVRDPVDAHHGNRKEAADPYADHGAGDLRNGYDRQRFEKADLYVDRGSTAGRHGRMSYPHPQGQSGMNNAAGPPPPFRGGRHGDAPGRRRYSQGDALSPSDQHKGDGFHHRDRQNFRNPPQPGFDYRAGPLRSNRTQGPTATWEEMATTRMQIKQGINVQKAGVSANAPGVDEYRTVHYLLVVNYSVKQAVT